MNLTERVETSDAMPNPAYKDYENAMNDALAVLEQSVIHAAAPIVGIKEDGWTAYIREDAEAQEITAQRGHETGAIYEALTAVLGYVERGETEQIDAAIGALGGKLLEYAGTIEAHDPVGRRYRTSIEEAGAVLAEMSGYLASGASLEGLDVQKAGTIAQGLEAIAQGQGDEFYQEHKDKLPIYPGVFYG
jgi:hypothetical protein